MSGHLYFCESIVKIYDSMEDKDDLLAKRKPIDYKLCQTFEKGYHGLEPLCKPHPESYVKLYPNVYSMEILLT